MTMEAKCQFWGRLLSDLGKERTCIYCLDFPRHRTSSASTLDDHGCHHAHPPQLSPLFGCCVCSWPAGCGSRYTFLGSSCPRAVHLSQLGDRCSPLPLKETHAEQSPQENANYCPPCPPRAFGFKESLAGPPSPPCCRRFRHRPCWSPTDGDDAAAPCQPRTRSPGPCCCTRSRVCCFLRRGQRGCRCGPRRRGFYGKNKSGTTVPSPIARGETAWLWGPPCCSGPRNTCLVCCDGRRGVG